MLSRSTEARDRGRKLMLLARYGLPEYWLINPAAKTIEVFSRTDDALLPVGAFTGDQEVTSRTLAGQRFPAWRLFRD